MCNIYQLELTREQILVVFEQCYTNMLLDYRQHTFLTEEQQKKDADGFLQRQQIRFAILSAISDTFERELPGELQPSYREAEGIMLFARGFGNAKSGGADTTATRDRRGSEGG